MGQNRIDQKGSEPQFSFSEKGTIIFLDLDRFGESIKEKTWDEYRPNPISGFLTNKLLEYITKFQAIHLYGINKKRGTEEAILLFLQDRDWVHSLFEDLRREVLKKARKFDVNTSLSIGIAHGPIRNLKVVKEHSRKEFIKHPTVYLAYKALKKAKKRGGNQIITY
jgi:GGDEF domain-containing protein